MRFLLATLGLGLLAFATLAGEATHARAQTVAPLPHDDGLVHNGVGSCASSTCHGAVAPWENSNVLQNEFITWKEYDRHSKAYATLLTDESARIARNLGLAEPAHEAALCLDCHAGNVPVSLRGEKFALSDGVGCESCHGGSEDWLALHVSSDATHEANLAAGLYPTEDPVARAEMCLSCHFGNEDQFVTHRIMGAGHPRMAFELDTYTAIEPAHYVVDADYYARKQVASGVKTWAIGQTVALRMMMDAIISPKLSQDGPLPELVLYDCHSCHTPFTNVEWRPRGMTAGLPPGMIRLHDQNILMLRALAHIITPGMDDRLFELGREMHRSSFDGIRNVVPAARQLRALALELQEAFAAHEFTDADVRALMNEVLERGVAGQYLDYAAAEQATMALGSLVETMFVAMLIDEQQYNEMQTALDSAYEATEDSFRYNPNQFMAALRSIRGSLARL